ncbi:putative uncharacterized protein DDB_G0282133 isoform X2 [Leptopilina heterotoma]|uniref:putative uncharacterized protein DDB_G0282133 isoform X2 n=1 Tax=Leptopilina heterotoma TaxID=63436 RepID=UPI001CA8DB61|nr:putative uncharacterized protein DDB_G0282133 isoform X2 [Leptopilina heterotoma]
MFFYLTISLLLNWSCVKGIEEQKQNVIPNQIAHPSKREIEKLLYDNQTYNLNQTTAKRVTVHYENSNGFMPIIVLDNHAENDKITSKENQKENESVLENNPAYSMEARTFLNLPKLGTNRKLFELSNRRNDLELLKVDSNTPEVATYEEFHDNKNQESLDMEKKKDSRARNKYRSKEVQNEKKYDRHSANSHNHNFQSSSYNTNQLKSNFGVERVNYPQHQQDASGYNLQRNVASKAKLVSGTNFNTRLSSGNEKKSKNEYFQLHANHNNEWKTTKPIIDVDDDEVDDYSLGIKHGSQRSTVPPSLSQQISSNPSVLSNFPSKTYGQEGGSDNTSRHYERSEDSQGSSDESLDYMDISEKPRKVHKSRRRPQPLELSRKLPKEHQYLQETDDKKRHNLVRAKQRHRQRNKQNHMDDDGRYQDESHEEKLNNSEADNVNQNLNTNSWNPLGSSNNDNIQSNGFHVNQIEKPKILFPVNVNLVPFTHLDQQNAMIQNLGAGMSIVSTATPYATTPQNLISKNRQTSNQVPDIIVGLSSMQNPVSVLLPHDQNPTARSASSSTPRSIFASASTLAPTHQQIALNHLPINHFLVPQPSLQSTSNILQDNSAIQIHPHGIQDGQYLATANIAVGNDAQKSNQKAIFQTQMVPVLLNQQKSQDSFVVARPKDGDQIQKATNDAFLSSMKDLQMQIQRNQLSNSYQNTDSIGSASNNINSFAEMPFSIMRTQMPVLGSKNVEIINSNGFSPIKPNLLDFAIINPVTPINQFTAMYTTPVPVMSTTRYINNRPSISSDSINLSNYVGSLTEYGAKTPSSSSYNFPPAEDSAKSASQKSSRTSTKANLKSEIAKYAEEVVRQSFKSMYDSQKLNNDLRVPENISIVDSSELAKLRNELLRLRPTGSVSKSPTDVLEAHQTENKLRTSNSRPTKNNSQKPAFSLEQIEHILKDVTSPDYYSKPDSNDGYNFKINDYLTPPKPSSFHDKPSKKRPPGPKPPGYSRSRSRKPSGLYSKMHGIETAASNNYEFGFDSPRYRNGPPFDHEYHETRSGRHGRSKYRKKNRAFNSYSTFSPPLKESERKLLAKDFYDINNPKFHNFLGLLMKNNRLPNGIPQPYSSNKEDEHFVKILEIEKQRLENKFYNDALQGLQKKLDESRLVQKSTK